MVVFDPNLTEMLFFDLEFYVPEKDRDQPGASLLANPGKKGQFLLGGVFTRTWPIKEEKYEIKFEHHWLWDYKDEKDLLKTIFQYFQDSWDQIKEKEPRHADLILCGIGITRFDLPILYIRSIANKVSKPEKLFDLYFKTKPVDLSNVCIPFFNREKVMYPKTANQILSRFNIDKEKSSSMSVWQKYDEKDFDWIAQRTEEEVKDAITLYNLIFTKICGKRKINKKPKPQRGKY